MPLATAVRLTSVPDASATVTSSPWTHLGTDIKKHFKAFAKSHYHGQMLAALAVSVGPLAVGLGKGYSSPALDSLRGGAYASSSTGGAGWNYAAGARGVSAPPPAGLTITEQQASWVASCSLLGALIGAPLAGVAMRYGRRRLLLCSAPPFSASWLLAVFANSVEMVYASSFFGGLCCALVLIVTQVYVSEIAAADVRGCLSAVLKVVGQVGVLISFMVGAYLDWRQLALVVAAAPCALFAAVLYLPETPSYLVLSGRDQEAARALRWLRGPGADAAAEIAAIKAHVNAARRMPAPAAAAALLTPALTTCGLMFFHRFCGANAFGFYAVTIFRQTFGGMDPHSGAVAVAFVQLLASLVSGLLIDTVGRLPLLIASSVCMSMALAGFGSFAYYESIQHRLNVPVASLNGVPPGQHDWIPLLCVLVFTVAFALGINPISWLLVAELFPLEHRGLGSGLAVAFSYACSFVAVKTFVDFKSWLGLHGTFWLYAGVSVAGLCFVVCFVPETRGRGLDELRPIPAPPPQAPPPPA